MRAVPRRTSIPMRPDGSSISSRTNHRSTGMRAGPTVTVLAPASEATTTDPPTPSPASLRDDPPASGMARRANSVPRPPLLSIVATGANGSTALHDHHRAGCGSPDRDVDHRCVHGRATTDIEHDGHVQEDASRLVVALAVVGVHRQRIGPCRPALAAAVTRPPRIVRPRCLCEPLHPCHPPMEGQHRSAVVACRKSRVPRLDEPGHPESVPRNVVRSG
jgi:hypothetical protein